jgi:hypothetical protein
VKFAAKLIKLEKPRTAVPEETSKKLGSLKPNFSLTKNVRNIMNHVKKPSDTPQKTPKRRLATSGKNLEKKRKIELEASTKL